MRNLPDRETIFQETMAGLAGVSPAEGTDVFLHYFMIVVGELDARAAHQLRDELTTRFGGRYCSSQVCRMMVELVNGHLASQQPHAELTLLLVSSRHLPANARARRPRPAWRQSGTFVTPKFADKLSLAFT